MRNYHLFGYMESVSLNTPSLVIEIQKGSRPSLTVGVVTEKASLRKPNRSVRA